MSENLNALTLQLEEEIQNEKKASKKVVASELNVVAESNIEIIRSNCEPQQAPNKSVNKARTKIIKTEKAKSISDFKVYFFIIL